MLWVEDLQGSEVSFTLEKRGIEAIAACPDARRRFFPRPELGLRRRLPVRVVTAVAQFDSLCIHPEPELERGPPFTTGSYDDIQLGDAVSYVGLRRERDLEASEHLAVLV